MAAIGMNRGRAQPQPKDRALQAADLPRHQIGDNPRLASIPSKCVAFPERAYENGLALPRSKLGLVFTICQGTRQMWSLRAQVPFYGCDEESASGPIWNGSSSPEERKFLFDSLIYALDGSEDASISTDQAWFCSRV